jgi:uncharacterized protein (TIGR03086 family)
MHTISTLVELDRQAVLRSVEIVETATLEQLGRPTPCEGWTLAELLSHMIAQHNGFAAAAAGNTADLSVWDAHPIGGDFAGVYATASEWVTTAFAEHAAADRSFWLPEIRDGGPFPAETAISFHLVDYVVHGWDVAASLGVEANYGPDLVAAAHSIAARVPAGPAREVLGAAFGPALLLGPDPSPMQEVLVMLGRSPWWPQSPPSLRRP